MSSCGTHSICPFRPGHCPGLIAPISQRAVAVLEVDVLDCATTLSEAEDALAEEYLLLMASGKYQTWQAQKMAELKKLANVTLARAHLEISLARLRRA